MNKLFRLVCLLIGSTLVLSSCKVTKYVDDDEHMLMTNEVTVDSTRLRSGKEYSYLRITPNRRLLGVPLYLLLYNAGDPEAEKGFGHWVSGLGDGPAVIDSTNLRKSSEQLSRYYFNKGYFDAVADYKVECNDRKRAKVYFTVKKKKPYFIRNIDYQMNSPELEEVVTAQMNQLGFKSWDQYNAKVLDQERGRLTELFRERGFYDFSKEFIYFEIDSALPGNFVDITMGIENKPVQEGDSIRYFEHTRFNLRDVNIVYRYDPNKDFGDTLSTYLGYRFFFNDELSFRPRLATDAILIEPGDRYKQSDVTRSYRHLINLKVFAGVNVDFVPVEGDSASHWLDAYVLLSPFKKQSLGLELEGTHTSGNFGAGGSIFYRNRNIFHGGQILEVRLNGALEAQQVSSDASGVFNTIQYGVGTTLHLPYFLLPFDTEGWMPKRYQPQTDINASYNQQIRVDFNRSILNFGLHYTFDESVAKRHKFELADFNFVKLTEIRDSSNIDGNRIRTGFQDAFIPTIGYTFLYNDQSLTAPRRDYQFFRGHIELAGNIFNGIARASSWTPNEDGQYELFGNPFAQYVKVDLDFRHYQPVLNSRRFEFRINGGIALPYGNSSVVPFEKQFFAGGANDNRGWVAYTLGPGGDTTGFDVNTGDIKIMATYEYRFSILGDLNGALFADVGNIWTLDPIEDQYNTAFRFDRFYEELAIGAGAGLRYDFGFFVFRLDAGFKIGQPSRPNGNYWTWDQLRFGRAVWNFGIGYPF